MENKKLYLLKLGKYFESTRLFETYNEAMDFVVDLFKRKKQIHHKWSGYSRVQNFNLYEVEVGVNRPPKAILRNVLNKELENRGLVRNPRIGGGWQ